MKISQRMKAHRIAVIASDGIGKEVIPAGLQVLKIAAEHGGFQLDFTDVPWGCDYYLRKAGSWTPTGGVSS